MEKTQRFIWINVNSYRPKKHLITYFIYKQTDVNYSFIEINLKSFIISTQQC